MNLFSLLLLKMSEEEEMSIYEEIMNIPVPPRIERILYQLAFDDDIFNLGTHDRDLEEGKEIVYNGYFRGSDAYDEFHQRIINYGVIYSDCFCISHNVASILERHGEPFSALVSDDLNNVKSWAYYNPDVFANYSDSLPMIGFIKWRVIDIFNHKLSSEKPTQTIEEYLRAFREYNNPRFVRMKLGMDTFYYFMNALDSAPEIPNELGTEIEERLMEILDMMMKYTFNNDCPNMEFGLSDNER